MPDLVHTPRAARALVLAAFATIASSAATVRLRPGDDLAAAFAKAPSENRYPWIDGLADRGTVFDFQGNTYLLDRPLVIPPGANIVLRDGNFVASDSFHGAYLLETGPREGIFTHQGLRLEGLTFDASWKAGGVRIDRNESPRLQDVVVRNVAKGAWGIELDGGTIHPVLEHVAIWGGTPYMEIDGEKRWDAFRASAKGVRDGVPVVLESGAPDPRLGANGLWIRSATDGHFRDVTTWGCYVGVRHSSQEDHFQALHASLSVFGLWIDGNRQDTSFRVNSSFLQCDFDDAAVLVQNTRGVSFERTVFRAPLEKLSTAAPLLSIRTWNTPIDEFALAGCRFDGHEGKKGLEIRNDWNVPVGPSVAIRDCLLHGVAEPPERVVAAERRRLRDLAARKGPAKP